jgi:hypothetical protein
MKPEMKSGKFNNSLPVSPSTIQGKLNADPKIASPSQLVNQALKSPTADLFKLLQVGQQLSATVIKALPAQAILQIKIGSTVLNAQTELKLPPGTPIKLEVVNLTPNKTPEFRLISLLSDRSEIISQAFKQALPRQTTLPEFLNQLQSTLSNKQLNSVIPKNIEQLAKQIIAETPVKGELIQPNVLRKQVLQSGIFLEKQFKQLLSNGILSNPNIQSDQKAKLLTLLSTLQTVTKQLSLKKGALTLPTPAVPVSEGKAASPLSQLANQKLATDLIFRNALSNNLASSATKQETLSPQLASELKELIGKTEGAISKIVLDQLASLPKEEGTKQSWQLDLPFHSGAAQADSLKLTITQEDKNSSSESEASWSVVLEISPPGLGTIYSKIILQGNQIDSYFWSEDAAICDLIDNHLGELEKRFSAVGLEAGQLETRNGKPVEADSPKPENQLVSERA